MAREFKFLEMQFQQDAWKKKFETIHVFENPTRDMELDDFRDSLGNDLWSRRVFGVQISLGVDREIKFYEKSGADALESMDFAGSKEFSIAGIADKVKTAANQFRDAFIATAESSDLAHNYEIALFGYFVRGKYDPKFKFFACRIGSDGRMMSAEEFNETVWEAVKKSDWISEYFYDLDRIDSKKVKTVESAIEWMQENGRNTRHAGFNGGKNEKWKDAVFMTTNKKGEIGFYDSNLYWER